MQVRKKELHELSHFLLILNLKLLYTRDKTGSMKHTLDEKQNERSETVERIWREGTLLWEDGPMQCYFFPKNEQHNHVPSHPFLWVHEGWSCPKTQPIPTMNNTKLYNQCSFYSSCCLLIRNHTVVQMASISQWRKLSAVQISSACRSILDY